MLLPFTLLSVLLSRREAWPLPGPAPVAPRRQGRGCRGAGRRGDAGPLCAPPPPGVVVVVVVCGVMTSAGVLPGACLDLCLFCSHEHRTGLACALNVLGCAADIL